MKAEYEVTLDLKRSDRIGLAEAIFCQGKSTEHLTEILARARDAGHSLLLTRLSPGQLDDLTPYDRRALDYEPVSRTAYFGKREAPVGPPRVAIVAAGTSDAHVTREVERTLAFSGVATSLFADVGVAGLWRLLDKVEAIRAHPVAIAVAGMDAALPTVLGGLFQGVLIGVPSSNGYGVAESGRSALHAMLASCAPGVVTMNVDNGYGAACAALRVLHAIDAAKGP